MQKKSSPVIFSPKKGLGNSLFNRRKAAGGVVDADAQSILEAQATTLPPRSSQQQQQRPRMDRRESARPAPSSGGATTSYSAKYLASGPSGAPPRAPRSPSTSSGSSSRPSSKLKSGGPPKFPSGPRSNSRNSPRSDRTPAVPLVQPTRFTANAPIDLAALISQDLQTRIHHSASGTLPLSRVAPEEADEKQAQAARVEALKERMGDYSRFWPEADAGGKETVGAARRMLALNASVGLKEREVLLATLEKALSR